MAIDTEFDLARIPAAMGDLLVQACQLSRLQTIEEVLVRIATARHVAGGLACEGLDKAADVVRAFKVECEAELAVSGEG